MLIYLDICCFNRPFDNQRQLLVRLQTEAKLYVQDAIREGALSLAWSAVLDLENAANPDPDRRDAVDGWKALANVDIETTPRVEAIAEEIVVRGVRPMDALHVASAVAVGANWLLTTDKGLLKKMQGDSRIRVADPIDFIRAWQETDHEDGC
jgi:predicted nucleic acid-binding protein